MKLLRALLNPRSLFAAVSICLAGHDVAQHAGLRTLVVAGEVPMTVALFYPTAVPARAVADIDMPHCPNCGAGELKIIAAILDRPVIEKILTNLGLDPEPLPRGRAREIGQH